MVYVCCVLLLLIFTSSVSSTYHPITFIPKDTIRSTSFATITVHNKSPVSHKRGINRSSRSFSHFLPLYDGSNELWHDSIYLAGPQSVEIGRGGHLTPDFTNGLTYSDPFLLTGVAAQAIAKLLYSHELFYSDYPHVSALLRNQEERRVNGLEGHRLGSIRPESPFFRYRTRYVYSH